MIKNNCFYIDKLKSVVILGFSEVFNKIESINSRNKVNTLLISSPDQVKNLKSKL